MAYTLRDATFFLIALLLELTLASPGSAERMRVIGTT